MLKAGAELPFTRLLLSDRERTRRRSTARTRSTAAGGAADNAATAPAGSADSAATAAADAAADAADVADAAICRAAKADFGKPAGTDGGRATCVADAGGGGTRDCLLYCVLTTVSRRDL